MSGLVEFLRARLEEDERAARAAAEWAGGVYWEASSEGDVSAKDGGGFATGPYGDGMFTEIAEHIARYDPARVLAEVEAKRQIVHAHGRGHECIGLTGKGDRSAADGEPWELWEPANTQDHGPCLVLRCLALPYADHPGYRPEWRPDTDPE